MKKASEVLGIISIILSVVVATITFQFIINNQVSNDGWAALGMFLAAIFFLVVALILTIPFVVFLVKLKYNNMIMYFYAHITYLVFSITALVISLLS